MLTTGIQNPLESHMKPMVALACLMSVGLGHAQNFPESAQNMWVYDTATEFARCGLWPVPYVIQHTGRRPATRYEIAVSLYINLQPMPEEIDKRIATASKFRTPANDAFDDLDRMILTFREELVQIGADWGGLNLKCREARRKAATLRVLRPESNVSNADKYFPDVPENHWAYDIVKNLKKYDLLVQLSSSPFYRFRGGVATHGEFARSLIVSIPKMPLAIRSVSQNTNLPEYVLLENLKVLCKEFSREIRGLGADLPTLFRQIDEVQAQIQRTRLVLAGKVPPFPDVPAGHWASGAVETLHSKGLLSGYPSGRFGGNL